MDGIENAMIKDVYVGYRRGCLTMTILTVGNGWLSSFGNTSLGSKFRWTEEINWAAWFICSVLDTVDVNSVEDLIKKPIRIKIKDGCIVAIGHFFKDVWFCPEEEIKSIEI